MPKRKREHLTRPVGDNLNGSGTSQLQQENLVHLLEHGKKSLFRALKLGKGFERQKLGRRQKNAQESAAVEETQRLKAEAKALKDLDLSTVAELHLYKSLLKTKSIASSPGFPGYIVSHVQSTSRIHDDAYSNVTARLYNSNPVKTTVAEILGNTRVILGLENAEGGRKKRIGVVAFESDPPKEMVEQTNTAANLSKSNERSEWEGISTPDELDEQPMSIMSEEDGVDYDSHRARLASSSSNEASGPERAGPLTSNGTKPNHYDPTEDMAIYTSSSKSSASHSPPYQETKTMKSADATSKSTTFLPSLMMGGYWSGTDSGADDDDDNAAKIEPRKNRKGQQARRQIWEKKFGQKANHIKSQSRDQGWDSRTGAQWGDDRGRRGRGRGASQTRSRLKNIADTSRGSGPNSEPVKPRADVKINQPDGPLHPSWLAAKKAKEQKQTATFTGKKIVFN